ncbi:MAG: hypothetical protein ACK2UN_00910 [Candidatus Promineifilaceae bacterium]
MIGEREAQLWGRTDWLVAFLLFFVLSTVYYATASGITSSNDGSHYALIRTMVENRTFALAQFDDYAEGNDIAVSEDGVLYSDRPPGTALAGTLFYLAGGLLPEPLQSLPSRHDQENARLAYVILLPVFAGAGTAVVLYGLMRLLALSRAAAVTAVLMFGLGTVHWKYSSVLFSHALSSFLVITAFFLAVRLVRQRGGRLLTFGLLGLLLGYSVLTEYSNALLVLIVLLYLLLNSRPLDWRSLVPSFAFLILGGLLSALFLAFYNKSNFGSIWTLSYHYAINYPWAGSFTTTFNFPLADGLKGLLVGGTGDGWCDGPCPNQGLLLLSPVLLLALPGWYFFYHEQRRECLLAAVIFLAYLLLFARHRTFHGFTADGRYLTPFLSLLALPVAYTMQWIYAQRARPWLRAALIVAAFALFLLSMRNMFLHIGRSYNYHLDLSLLDGLFSAPGALFIMFGQVFRNAINLPLLWLFEIGAALLIVGAAFVIHKAANLRPDSSD